ncbi:MAG: cadherin-like beta sandwich domain-containing protein [bacterium]
MGNIKNLIITLVLSILMMLPTTISAATGTVAVTSASTVTVGNSVTYTVTLTGSEGLGSWQMELDYDKSYLSLQSTTSDGGGTLMSASYTSSGIKTKTYTYTFKTLKSGSTTVKVSSYLAYAFSDMSEMNLSSTGKTVTIKTQAEIEASYSKDNTLKSLTISDYSFEEDFSSSVYTYNVIVPEGTEKIKLTATKNDANASVTGDGEKEVSSGMNTFEITVRAQNGSEQVYKVNVEVIDQNPIIVDINGEEMYVVKLVENLTSPSAFDSTTIIIDEIEIPAFINENLGFTLVGLKDVEGNVKLYIYEEENDLYLLYNEKTFTQILFYQLDFPLDIDIPVGYSLYTITVGEEEVQAYKLTEDSNYSLIYGVNIETGNKNLYMHDSVEGTIQIYNQEEVEIYVDNNDVYKLCSLIFAGLSGLLIIILMIVLTKKKKIKNKKINKKEYETLDKKTPKKKVKKQQKNKNKKEIESEEDF